MKLDIPFEICPLCKEQVALDQTQRECANEHACGDRSCPLEKYFTGHEFIEEGEAEDE